MGSSCDSNIDMLDSESICDDDDARNTFAVVNSDEVKSLWTSRVRMLKVKNPRSHVVKRHQALYVSKMKSCDSLHSIPEYAGLPGMTQCDSLLSMSSSFSSIN